MGDDDIVKREHFANIVNKYADMVLRLALTYLGNRADAQDVYQDVFNKLFKYERPFNDAEHEKAWIIRVTMNTCKYVIRSPWKKWFAVIEDMPDRHIENLDIVSVVITLPRKYRLVIHLYYYEGYKTAEISNIFEHQREHCPDTVKTSKGITERKDVGRMGR
ncbi:RNA polymerase sigma factor [Paenibacillus lutrae]|uniref:Sigma-70 family RNA polymerase sigma factor n=1 Tax=Paenibacillus lutrae TaxID=2078573 RepID=A0A7X3FEB5_9BACL|nr:sigma-70 family RNA polymerase sigma factor [Paenibacillus lutrae]MVO98045.1 sigma-70 family RNA polymerase sigma factor [Paenibacillus lutrae]